MARRKSPPRGQTEPAFQVGVMTILPTSCLAE
jgi:hypothetical protein